MSVCVLRAVLRAGPGAAGRARTCHARTAVDRSGECELAEVSPSWPSLEHPELLSGLLSGARVIPDFVTPEEETTIMSELEPQLKKLRYEFEHWDGAIQGYRETEREHWGPGAGVMARLRETARAAAGRAGLLSGLHILDLAPTGHIAPHIDAVRFCGDVIAGICLLSPAIMILRHETHQHLELTLMLPQRCLYILSGVARSQFTHEVPSGERSVWRGTSVTKRRRVSIICRSEPSRT